MKISDPANARSRRTRAAILAAARSLLEEEGFAAFTMGAVAERAGVTRRTLYLHVPSRSALVEALFDAVGEQEGLADSLAPVWAAPDAAAALDEWARHLARFRPRVAAIDRAIERVHTDDPDAAAHRALVTGAKRASCRRLARRLAAEGVLAPGWTAATATDVLVVLSSGPVADGLLDDCGWSARRYADRLSALLRSTLLVQVV